MKFDQNGWLDMAVEVDVLENTFDRAGYKPKFIVLHGTAGGTDAVAIANYMKSTVGSNNPVSTHFVIGRDGTIAQCVPISLAAFGNGIIEQGHASYILDNVNPNLYTISIEHAKPSTDNSDVLTSAQATSSFQLLECLCDTYGIPKQSGDANGGIIRHADIEPINRARCPGPYPYPDLWAFFRNGGSNMGVPNGWKDNGTILTAPNGVDVVLGFREYILNSAWNGLNYPVGHEESAAQIEENVPVGPDNKGTRQVFQQSELGWSATRNVFECSVGSELAYVRAERDALKVLLDANTQAQQIISLQAKIATAVADLSK